MPNNIAIIYTLFTKSYIYLTFLYYCCAHIDDYPILSSHTHTHTHARKKRIFQHLDTIHLPPSTRNKPKNTRNLPYNAILYHKGIIYHLYTKNALKTQKQYQDYGVTFRYLIHKHYFSSEITKSAIFTSFYQR